MDVICIHFLINVRVYFHEFVVHIYSNELYKLNVYICTRVSGKSSKRVLQTKDHI